MGKKHNKVLLLLFMSLTIVLIATSLTGCSLISKFTHKASDNTPAASSTNTTNNTNTATNSTATNSQAPATTGTTAANAVVIKHKPIAEYLFGSDNPGKDTAGNGHDGQVIGGIMSGNDGPTGQCGIFSSGEIKVPDSPDIDLSGPFSISAWVKLDKSQQQDGSVVAKMSEGGYDDIYDLRVADNDSVQWGMDYTLQGGGEFALNGSDVDWTTGWHLITVTDDGTNACLYDNAQLKDNKSVPCPSGSSTPCQPDTSNNNMVIGRHINSGGVSYFKGEMADVQIYDYALNFAEVNTLYNNPGKVQYAATATTSMVFTVGSTSYTVNGQPETMDTAPVINNSRTLLPVKYVADPLKATTTWDQPTQKVTIGLNGKTLEMWIGQSNAKVNGTDTPIDANSTDVTPVVVPPGRTMLPLRFIAENMGCKVNWDASTQEITVTYSGY
jgi:hypothetical protein